MVQGGFLIFLQPRPGRILWLREAGGESNEIVYALKELWDGFMVRILEQILRSYEEL